MHFIPGLLQVNCDRVAPQLLSISTSSLPLSLSLPRCSMSVCTLCMKRAEQKNREESGGRVASTYNRLPGDSIKHNEFAQAFPTSVYCSNLSLPLRLGFVSYQAV